MSGAKYVTSRLPSGGFSQSAVPKEHAAFHTTNARGLLMRGVVLDVYYVDQKKQYAEPEANENKNRNPDGAPAKPADTEALAVYANVLVYSGKTGAARGVLERVLVSSRTGLHDGEITVPRASSKNIIGVDLRADLKRVNPADLDGDHVIVGFLDDDIFSPVIIGYVPHPASGKGAEGRPNGRSTRVVTGEGRPNFIKHHGSHYGVDTNGNFDLDLTRAHKGLHDPKGREPRLDADPAEVGDEVLPTDGSSGNVRVRLRQGSVVEIDINTDPTDPGAGSTSHTLLRIQDGQVSIVGNVTGDLAAIGVALVVNANDGKVTVTIDTGANLELIEKDGAAELKLGDGAVHIAIVEHLQTLYTQLKAKLDAFDAAYMAHTHLYVFGPTGPASAGTPPGAPVVAPPWDSAINSTKMSLPDG